MEPALHRPRSVICYGRIWGWTCQFEQSSKNDYPSAFGPEDIANLTAAFEAALSKLELVDRKDPMTMTVAIGSPLGEPSVEIKTQQERITRGRRSGPALHGLLNLLFYELLDSLRCLKATAVAFIKSRR